MGPYSGVTQGKGFEKKVTPEFAVKGIAVL